MLTFITAPASGNLLFTGAILDIILASDSDTIFEIGIRDSSGVYQYILQEKYTPVDNIITIYNIAHVIEQHLPVKQGNVGRALMTRSIAIFAKNQIESIVRTFYVIPGHGMRGEVEGKILSMLTQKTTFGKPECLSFNLKDIVSATVNFIKKDGALYQQTISYVQNDAMLYIQSFDPFAYALLAGGIDKIDEVTVWLTKTDGKYTLFNYKVDHRAIRNIKNFAFINRFGVIEIATLYGEEQVEWDRSAREIVVLANGVRRPVGESEQFFMLNTGIQPSNRQAYWLADLFDSRQVWLLLGETAENMNDETIAIPVVFDEIETKYNPNDALTRNFYVKCLFADPRKNTNFKMEDTAQYPLTILTDKSNSAIVNQKNDIIGSDVS